MGDPRNSSSHSPYIADMVEVVQRFATSPARCRILSGLLDLRQDLVVQHGIHGWMWLDGSFVEDCETLRGRDPGDIDAVIFAGGLSDPAWDSYCRDAKPRFSVDLYPVPLELDALTVIKMSTFWHAFFSHDRRQLWKGLLEVPLGFQLADGSVHLRPDDAHARGLLKHVGLADMTTLLGDDDAEE